MAFGLGHFEWFLRFESGKWKERISLFLKNEGNHKENMFKSLFVPKTKDKKPNAKYNNSPHLGASRCVSQLHSISSTKTSPLIEEQVKLKKKSGREHAMSNSINTWGIVVQKFWCWFFVLLISWAGELVWNSLRKKMTVKRELQSQRKVVNNHKLRFELNKLAIHD